jgi:hypothetical protein
MSHGFLPISFHRSSPHEIKGKTSDLHGRAAVEGASRRQSRLPLGGLVAILKAA